MRVRDATAADAPACAAVYAPYVTGTPVSFESEPPGVEEMARRIGAAQQDHAWLVAEVDDEVVGYAYATAYRSRPAYRWTCETSVYVAPGQQRGGIGRALYEALLGRLAGRGYRTAVAAMTLPNPASAGLHTALGFEPVGVLHHVGWKAGSWHDVAVLQRPIGEEPYGGEQAGRPDLTARADQPAAMITTARQAPRRRRPARGSRRGAGRRPASAGPR